MEFNEYNVGNNARNRRLNSDYLINRVRFDNVTSGRLRNTHVILTISPRYLPESRNEFDSKINQTPNIARIETSYRYRKT